MLQGGCSRPSVASRGEEIRLGKRPVDCALGLCVSIDEILFFGCCLFVLNHSICFVFTDVSSYGSETARRDVVASVASLPPTVDYGILSIFFLKVCRWI